MANRFFKIMIKLIIFKYLFSHIIAFYFENLKWTFNIKKGTQRVLNPHYAGLYLIK